MTEIEYWKKETWQNFIKDYIVPLNKSADTLIGYWNYLKERVDGVQFEDMDDSLKTILLGGVTSNGEYSARSLAKFYKMFFGAFSDVQVLIIAQKERVTPDVVGKVEESIFIKFVKSVSDNTGRILEFAYQNDLIDSPEVSIPEVRFDDLLGDPKKVVELIKAFYDNAIKITVNYNQYTFFLWTIRKITRRYLETAYPQLQDESKFEQLKSLLGLEEYFIPEIEEKKETDKKLKQDYTLWYFPKKSFGDTVCKFNEIIWEFFGQKDFRKVLEFMVSKVPNLKEDFAEKIARESYRVGWEVPEYIGFNSGEWTYCDICDYNAQWHIYYFSDIYVKYHYHYGRSSVSHNLPNPISILEIFDNLSPGFFLGLIKLCIQKAESYGNYKLRFEKELLK